MAPKVSPGTDPRSVITPDAFRLDPPLLGIPLARPGRRFWALMIDLMAVIMITAATDNFWFILPFIIGFFFLSRAFQKEGEQTRLVKAKRFSLGCLGLAVLAVSLIVVGAVQIAQNQGDEIIRRALEESGVNVTGPDDDFSLDDVLSGVGQAAELGSVDDPERAYELALGFGRRVVSAGTEIDDAGDMLREIMPDEVDDQSSEDIIDEVLVTLEAEGTAAAAAETATPEALAEEARVMDEVAGDTLAALNAQISNLEASVERQRARAEEAESGLWAWLRSKLDTLSFGLGWWTMYFAILMPWMKGATPGKKIMGLRVVRLDGQPMTWWHAFERAGGYAAGLATGLLGFVQILWDPNRQAIHDKVAGTVVIQAGAQRVPGQWEHLVESENVRIAREKGDTGVADAPAPPSDPDPTPDDQ